MNQPFSSLLMMCGGGMRFGAYLGAYAALCERGRRPDALLASCGGGFAALTVALAPQPEDARRLLCSPAMHRVLMLARASSAPRRQTLFQAAWRWYLYRSPQRLARYLAAEGFDHLTDELARLALFALADGANAHNWLDPLFQAAGGIRADAPALLISAARLENENGRPRLRQLLFAPSAQAPLPAVPDCATAALSPRIAAAVEIRPLQDWQAALYATISDMYYLAPLPAPEGGVYLGGVVDLLPIEQAAALAGTVYAEHKPPYARALAHEGAPINQCPRAGFRRRSAPPAGCRFYRARRPHPAPTVCRYPHRAARALPEPPLQPAQRPHRTAGRAVCRFRRTNGRAVGLRLPAGAADAGAGSLKGLAKPEPYPNGGIDCFQAALGILQSSLKTADGTSNAKSSLKRLSGCF